MQTKPEYNNYQSDNGNKIIVLKDVVKQFGKNVVINKINLTIEKGKTTVIIGPSGCGKTVLIKHMLALLRPTSGEVFFKGQRIDNLEDTKLNKIRLNFGFLFQGGALFDSMTVAENIRFPVVQHYKVKDENLLTELVKSKLSMVGLDGYQNYYPAHLSGGQK